MSLNSKRKLFRMTQKRRIMLSSIITTLNINLDSVDEDGLNRILVLNNDNLTKEKRKEELMELDKELKELSLIHDVLEVVCLHEDDVFLQFHMKEDRGWRNEWDVPLDIFNESIDKMIEILKWHQHSQIVHIDAEQFKQYDKEVEFLIELKAFRNQGES